MRNKEQSEHEALLAEIFDEVARCLKGDPHAHCRGEEHFHTCSGSISLPVDQEPL